MEVKKRSYLSHLSAAINKLNTQLSEESPNEERIKSLIEQVQTKFQKVEDIVSRLQDAMDETTLEADIDKMDALENQVIEVKVKAQSVLEKIKQKAQAPKAEASSVPPVHSPYPVSAKLPDATLREFHGDEEDFPSFMDNFKALVDNNPNLPDVEKFSYLRGVVKVDVINHYPLTADHYKIALEKLQKVYGDKTLIATKHLNSLLDMDKRRKPANNKELEEFYHFLETKITCLDALKKPISQDNEMLITLIYRQLPKKLKEKVAGLDAAHSTVNKVMEIILSYLNTTKRMDYRECSEDSESDSDYAYNPTKEFKTRKKDFKQSEMLQSHQKSKTAAYEGEQDSDGSFQPTSSAAALPILSQRQRSCPYCRENHSPLYCQNVPDVNQRRDIIRRNNRCYNCLGTGHRVPDCRNEGRCRNCQGKHHTSICIPGRGSQTYQQQRNASTEGQGAGRGSQTYQQQGNASTEGQGAGNKKSNQVLNTTSSWEPPGAILLEIAQAEVRKPGSQTYVPVNIFFDKGSQLSYCTNKLREKLELNTLYRDVMETNTFGSTEASVSNSDVVTIQIIKGEYVKDIPVHVSNHICNPLPSFKISKRKLQELRGITLASRGCRYDGEHEVDILIGSDLYWQFMEGETLQTSWGAGAVKTTLGWLLSGPMSDSTHAHTNVHLTTSKVIKSLKLDEVAVDKGWINQKLSEPSPYNFLDKMESHERDEVLNSTSSAAVLTKPINKANLKDHNPQVVHKISALSVLSVGDKYQDSNPTHNKYPEAIVEVDDWFQYKMQTAITDSDVELRWFWDLEHIGITPEEQQPSTQQQFLQNIKYKEDTKRYEVQFPCKDNLLEALPDNHHICEVRLQSLLSKLNKPGNEDMLAAYDEIIQKQLRDGIIEEVNTDQHTDAVIHYLPHHGVVKKDKPSSAVRIVYDGSAKSCKRSLSLNQCLQAGPSLVNNLASVFLQFRMFQIGLVGDIGKAFLQMFLAEDDRDLTRFLWRENGKETNPLKTYRFTRVPFGLTSSPFLLHATIIYHLSQYKDRYPELVSKLLRSFYVDDMLTGADTEEEAVELANESDEVMKEASMELNKWTTNAPKVLENSTIPEARKAGETTVKVLGNTWNTQTDQFEYNVQNIIDLAERLKPTKRSVLRILQKVYDPLGILSPYLITAKVLMQELCRLKLSWDELLPDDKLTQWRNWTADLKKLKSLKIPRCIRENRKSTLELVGFSDASKVAYAAVVYLRCVTEIHGHKGVKTNFIIAKTRVAPMKQQTIPRLELLGAVLLARLVYIVKEFLSRWTFENTTYCTDSKNVYYWIQSLKKYNQYIAKLLAEINSLTSKEQWQHVDGKDNPADYPTRGMSVDQLCDSKEWFHAPSWCSDPDFCHARKCPVLVPPTECLKEELKTAHTHTVVESSGLSKHINLKDYSTLGRLLSLTAYIYMFVKKFIEKKDVTYTEMLRHAEVQWVINQQKQHCSKLLPYLKGEAKKPSASIHKQFDLFIDESGVIRCSGRFKYANLSYKVKYPALLPSDSYLTTLIIKDRHRRIKHAGIKSTLAEVREDYWTPGGRRMVQGIIRRCVICRRLNAKPFRAPGPSPLPPIRLSEMPAFTNTGVDFAGPLYCRERGRGKRAYKTYISLFTCASVRAIHLELIPNMTAFAFRNAMIRFVSTRGIPHCMISDNAKTFKKTAEDLDCLVTRSPTQEFMEDNRIVWLFYLEKSPWWGGFIERMVGSVKKVLRKSLYRTFLSYDEMVTLLKQVESIVNSRPLTCMFEDDVEEPLTPSHLLIGKRSTQLPTDVPYICDTDERNTYRESILQSFRQRWKKEYLTQLQEYHIATLAAQGEEVIPQVGEIVIMMESSSRPTWKLARVTQLHPSRDGKIRSVEIRKSNGNLARRPPQLLIPLESRCNSDNL